MTTLSSKHPFVIQYTFAVVESYRWLPHCQIQWLIVSPQFLKLSAEFKTVDNVLLLKASSSLRLLQTTPPNFLLCLWQLLWCPLLYANIKYYEFLKILSPNSLSLTPNSLIHTVNWVTGCKSQCPLATSTLRSHRLPSFNISKVNCMTPYLQILLLLFNVFHPCCSCQQHRNDLSRMALIITSNSTALLNVKSIHFSPSSIQPTKKGHHHLSLELLAQPPNRSSYCDPCLLPSIFCSTAQVIIIIFNVIHVTLVFKTLNSSEEVR